MPDNRNFVFSIQAAGVVLKSLKINEVEQKLHIYYVKMAKVS